MGAVAAQTPQSQLNCRKGKVTELDWVFLFGGLVGLFLGGEALVRGAVGIARKLTIPPLLIGLTVVGFGTSTPELLVSVDAALRGVPDIAIGNIVGSNIGNILLIVGLSALVWPIRVMGGTLRRDTAVMMAAAFVLIPLFWLGQMGRLSGGLLVAGLIGYLVWAYLHPCPDNAEDDPAPVLPLWQSALWVALGLGALMIGARFLVDGAVNIARGYGVSEAFIGLTIVAVGTSLPELATSLIAAFRRQSEIAIGNIVGSNIFNVLGILGVTALIAPIPVADRFLRFDLPVMIASSVLLTGLLLLRPQIGRPVGVVLLLAYAVYVWTAQG
jgi:cation:H+ antiporter